MAEGWLIGPLRRTAQQEAAEIYTDDVVALAGWANSCAVMLRQAVQGLPVTDPMMVKDLIETGVRIGILPPSPVRENP